MKCFKTNIEFAEFCGVTHQAISKAKQKGLVRKNENGEYDPLDVVNKRYIMAYSQNSKKQRGVDPESGPLTEKEKLELKKLHEEVELRKVQRKKINLAVEVDKKNLVPVKLVSIWIGYFASGIRNNFLQIGNRVARGDVKLRNRIEKEIKQAIEKTISQAAASLKKQTEQLLDGWYDEAADD